MEEIEQSKKVEFKCPACEITPQNKIIFLCNTCEQEELLYKERIYVCPSCSRPSENFECIDCESKEVRMSIKE